MYTINSPELIAACGLYCGACRKYKKCKCPGCQELQRCDIRKCCQEKDYHTCAECDTDVRECAYHNTFINRLASFVFNSDRAACIRYIKHHGEERFAEKMTWNEQMSFRKRE